MRYTIPYDDKITIPHIKLINTIGINTDNLFYDSKELSGEVIIDGEYLTDDSNDVMVFSHDIPVSFLIDDADINPQINISNFRYEVIPGRGLEVMFELDVILVEANVEEVSKELEESIEKRIDDIDKQLEENQKQLDALTNTSEELVEEVVVEEETLEDTDNDALEFSSQIDKNLELLIGERKVEEVVEVSETEEVVRDEEVVEEVKKPKAKKSKKRKENVEEEDTTALLSVLEDEIKQEEETKEVVEIVETEKKLSTTLQSTSSSFDTGFLSSEKDRYTTYKIILLEENENIDQVLEERNLSRALVCDEYKSDNTKVILKIENDGN